MGPTRRTRVLRRPPACRVGALPVATGPTGARPAASRLAASWLAASRLVVSSLGALLLLAAPVAGFASGEPCVADGFTGLTREGGVAQAPTASGAAELPTPADPAEASDGDPPADGRTARPSVQASVVGSVGIAAGGGPTAALTFGGPRVSVVAGDWRFTLSFYPSLVYSDDWGAAKVRPLLGAGPELAWRSIAVFAPLYVVGETYRPLVGLAWRFR